MQVDVNQMLQSFLSLGIVGVGLSAAIQLLQDKFGVEGNTTKLIAFVGSIVLGAAVYFLSALPIWANIIGVLTAASTTYALVFSGSRKK